MICFWCIGLVQRIVDCRSVGVVEVVLYMELDVILRMNWLESNHVRIKCYEKTVSFPAFDASDKLFVSAKQVEELMNYEAKVFMILSSMKAQSKVVIGELPVVCDFSKVFPEDISDLQSEREIKFSIDLVSGTTPVSMALYRMYDLELSELKKQLEDLLEKKFVQPSVSQWGALVLLVKKKNGSMWLCVDY
ncbi:uncharacterized protein LOC127131652 [Lathyrus oleraceus]|uniref:uncharacterized protein LOC127131652 n=1 Tax=Pisum sativum TaxID=3888 RepID=UPI0021D06602|nr:uncharacterized protein LOC127131652 [Pisum sativum]